ncbi:M20/M25/M40 family metallo-hydrolase [Roseomonas sp. HJA6]|uniref:M20/M25/M40 family metallo-hydrolase n=1 Tax=Roseomonas alba TaxID=2846776 RepID=A0ABS7ADQ9_9PROT|nr:M20/M25/M40 family metallo-hydrolase [Neoroseomonas alba]MBW6400447.1 M20/M25/M40 family metallo-hydrolase [Neoroseomonas alba]
MSGTRDGAIGRARAAFSGGQYLDHLRRLVAVPTESQNPGSAGELRRYCAETIPSLLQGLGFAGRVAPNPLPDRGPALIAERREGAGLPTVLIYGHGDVVRGMAGRWSDGLDPWAVTIRDDKWYGRGTADNKGQHLIAIEALRAVLEERGRLGFNAVLFIETGEEVGSPGLREIVRRECAGVGADVFIGLDGPRQATMVPELRLGCRGGVAFDLRVALRDRAHHSGHWGGVLADPAVLLAHALASILGEDGRILVEGWTPAAIPDAVRRACASLVFEELPGLPQPDAWWGEPGLTKAERIFAWTSAVVLAGITGNPEAPVNAVQAEARLRMQVRHTVDVDGATIVPALRRHLDAHGHTRVEIHPVKERDMFPASRTDPDDPWIVALAESLSRSAGVPANLVPNSSGGNPSAIFAEELGVPVTWIPSGHAGSNQHAPDEHALSALLGAGLALMTGVWWDIGEGRHPPARSRGAGSDRG